MSNEEKNLNNNDLVKAHLKLQQMRKNYMQFYLRGYDEIKNALKAPTEEEKKMADQILANVQKTIDEVKQEPEDRTRSILIRKREKNRKILSSIIELKECNLTADQSCDFYNKIESIDNAKIKTDLYDIAAKKLQNALEREYTQTEDIEQLQKLRNKVDSKMLIRYNMYLGAIISRIDAKITNLKAGKLEKKPQLRLSENVMEIVKGLLDGTVNVKNARAIIKSEVKRESNVKPDADISSVTQDILSEIKKQIIESDMPIKNPSLFTTKAQKILGIGIEDSFDLALQKLLPEKQFKEAKQLGEKLAKKQVEESSVESARMKQLQEMVKTAEVGDICLRIIKLEKASYKDEYAYINFIEKVLSRGVSPKSIKLGKNKLGDRDITLENVMQKREKTDDYDDYERA